MVLGEGWKKNLNEISRVNENLYKEGCPVVIQTGVLYCEEEDIFSSLTIRSISPKTITSVLVDLHVFDRANIEVEVVRDYLYLVTGAKRDDVFGEENHIEITNPSAKIISVALRRVAFDDETVWDGSGSLLFECIPPRRTIERELEDPETVEQFRRDFAKDIAKNKEAVAKFVPMEYKNLWFCSCGEINWSYEEECHQCGAMYLPQRIHIDNRVEIATNLSAHKKNLADQAEQARLEAERKAAEAAAAKAEAERKAAEEKALAELKARRKKRARQIALAITIPAVIALIIYLFVLNTYILPQQKYDSAKALLTEARFDEAVTAFSAMGNYSDSPEQIVEAKFQKAEQLLKDKNYQEAITQFEAVQKDRDVKERIQECKYQRAGEIFAEKNYGEALTLYKEIDGYQDAADKISLCNLNLAKEALKKGDLPASTEYFKLLSGTESTELQTLYCEKGTALYEKGKTKQAMAYFALVSDEALKTKINGVYYAGGLSLIKAKKYGDAAKIFTDLKDYKDSATQLLRIEYLKAEAQLEAKKYPEAIKLYKNAGDYKDAKTKIKECSYRIAKAAYDSGKYEDATKKFEALGSYSDSAAMALESQYQQGAALLNSGSVVEAYNLLYPIRSYDKAYALLVSNSQFYIHVYDVGVGPNPLT